MLRKSLREIHNVNFQSLCCFDCHRHFCIEKDFNYRNHSIGCPHCGRRFILEYNFVEVNE